MARTEWVCGAQLQVWKIAVGHKSVSIDFL